jgi:hypothetical protein
VEADSRATYNVIVLEAFNVWILNSVNKYICMRLNVVRTLGFLEGKLLRCGRRIVGEVSIQEIRLSSMWLGMF